MMAAQASLHGFMEIVLLLFEKGSPSIKQATRPLGITPLGAACEKGHTDIALLLLGKGADINATTSEKRTPLLHALNFRREATALMLIENGASVDAIDHDGFTAMHLASKLGSPQLIKACLELGADPNQRLLSNPEGSRRKTPLHTLHVQALRTRGSPVLISSSVQAPTHS